MSFSVKCHLGVKPNEKTYLVALSKGLKLISLLLLTLLKPCIYKSYAATLSKEFTFTYSILLFGLNEVHVIQRELASRSKIWDK